MVLEPLAELVVELLFYDDLDVSDVLHKFLDAQVFFQQPFAFSEKLKLKFGFFWYFQFE